MPVEVVVREAAVVEDPALLDVLDEAERARAARKRRPTPFVTAHAVSRRLLGDLVGADPRSLTFVRRCTTCGSESHGKPSLVDSPWGFSLSYTGGLVVVAAALNHGVGVDVEELDEADFADFDRVTLAAPESAHLAGLTGEALLEARARTWARKESILKATGHGLVVDPTEVVVSAPGEAPALRDWLSESTPPAQLALADVPLDSPSHRAAVSVVGAAEVTVRRG
ncbi:hypothetical protein GCM10027055_20660 [Janibacter alkaliphilus]|uniref:4'-phosphopantetheinyl transferase n=1 Tax=Janibacter alkaliphilus TaxID=1069963 RepID=A0A852X6K3_9MICO|nr:4'-phosphopantetheinyl transferase superfamily protein [Janibacter alkaliphilus]NYG38626.1 4'-phosphopantetheinyl transferase [Janibacter alkaliphilus]